MFFFNNIYIYIIKKNTEAEEVHCGEIDFRLPVLISKRKM